MANNLVAKLATHLALIALAFKMEWDNAVYVHD